MAQEKAYPLRLKPDLRAKLEEIAARNNRSLNREIEARLEASLEIQAGDDMWSAIQDVRARVEALEKAFAELQRENLNEV